MKIIFYLAIQKEAISNLLKIGEFLKELELTEGKATGLPKIKKAMKRNGSPDPIFKTDDDRTYFLTILPAHFEKVQDESLDKALDKALVKFEDQLNQTEISVLKICQDAPKSVTQISSSLGHSKVSGNIKKALSNLLNLNYLEFIIPDKPKSKNQKYRITKKGIL